MNDVFEIRVEIYPETEEMVVLYSFWNGRMPVVYQLPLQQAIEHLQEHLESLADDMAEETDDEPGDHARKETESWTTR